MLAGVAKLSEKLIKDLIRVFAAPAFLKILPYKTEAAISVVCQYF
jgi:hypothetical protein